MSSESDENKLKRGLQQIIEIISKTSYAESSFINSNEIYQTNKIIMENLTTIINNKLKSVLDSLSLQYQDYFLDFFHDYKYDYLKGSFNETIKNYILKQFCKDLYGIIDSFDAFKAAFDGNVFIVKSFIENYPKYKNKSSIFNTTLLYSSSRNNHFDLVKYLIEQAKCFVNIKNRINKNELNGASGSTALHAACYYGHINIVKYLFNHGANYFIKNTLEETPIQNGLRHNCINEFLQNFLILNYLNLSLPQSTIYDNDHVQLNSLWEYKTINDNHWILFDNNQSNKLHQSLLNIENNEFYMNINNDSYLISLKTFLSSLKSNLLNDKYMWIRCRGSSIENFHVHSKWQIMFYKYLSLDVNKSIALDFYSIDNNIILNQWYYLNDSINEQIDDAINYRRKHFYIHLPSTCNHLFDFNLESFSFSNNDQTIKGFLRWLPDFVPTHNQFVINKYKQSNINSYLEPLSINIKQSFIIDQSQSLTTNRNDDDDDYHHHHRSIVVRYGNIIEEKSDIIVVGWSSKSLLDIIYHYSGSSVRTLINNKFENKFNNSLISIQTDGSIKSKTIYFIDVEIHSDINLLRKSLENVITVIMKKAHEDNCKHISFSKMDLDNLKFPLEYIIEIIIKKIHEQQILYKMFVSFVIESTEYDLYYHLSKQIHLLDKIISMNLRTKTIEKSQIQLEKGDIIKQNVDVIIVSLSSDILKQTIIIEGGEEVYQFYEKESKLNPNNLLLSCPPGNLLCKRIFFVNWNPSEDVFILKQSIIDLIYNIIQNILSNNYQSIAFPPIGFNYKNISTSILIKTLIQQLIYQIKSRNLSLTIKFIILPDQNEIYEDFYQEIFNDEQLIDNDSKIPLDWDKSDDTKDRFIVSFQSKEYKQIEDEFNRSMNGKFKRILRIERVQNQRWYFQYLAHKKEFFKRLNQDTEQHLYHGCSFKFIDLIINDCFNRSFAGLHGTSYGNGVYFSSNPTYFHQFTKPNSNGERFMFIAQVLVGRTVLGNSSMKTRPPGYDSTTDGNHLFVTYHDAQAYAQYLITYK